MDGRAKLACTFRMKSLVRMSLPAWKQTLSWGIHATRAVNRGVLSTVMVLWRAAFAFFTEEALIRASSLAFTTLISLVPLVTVALSVMNISDVSQESKAHFEVVLAQYFLPAQSREIVTLIFDAADDISHNINAVGILSFCGTLILMARELEGHILKICNKTTTWLTSIAHYVAFLVFAPLGLLLAVLALQAFEPLYEHLAGLGASVNYTIAALSVVLMVLLQAFSGYALGWRASAAGALAASLAAWGAWKGCAMYFAHSAALPAYGKLACIPAFLLWLYLAWCCVLYGIQVAAKAHEVLLPERCTSKLALPVTRRHEKHRHEAGV